MLISEYYDFCWNSVSFLPSSQCEGVLCIGAEFRIETQGMFSFLLGRACTKSRPFLFLTDDGVGLGVHKNLGRDTADPKWPKAHVSVRIREGGSRDCNYLCLPSHCCVWWGAQHLPMESRGWIPCFALPGWQLLLHLLNCVYHHCGFSPFSIPILPLVPLWVGEVTDPHVELCCWLGLNPTSEILFF